MTGDKFILNNDYLLLNKENLSSWNMVNPDGQIPLNTPPIFHKLWNVLCTRLLPSSKSVYLITKKLGSPAQNVV